LKNLIIFTVVTFLIGCASPSEIRQNKATIAAYKDYEIVTEKQMSVDLHTIDSLKNLTNYLKVHNSDISKRRDQWFFNYTAAQRTIDTLYMSHTKLEDELDEIKKKCK